MAHVYERVKQRARLLERLELAIPGYRGYKEKELRREADRLVREHLLRQLEPAYRDFKSAMAGAAGDPGLAQEYNRVQAVFDRVLARLRTASYGYSGFFDAVKVEERELDRLLEYDWNLVSSAEKLAKAARDAALSEPAKLKEALAALHKELLAFEDLLAKREEILRGSTVVG